MTSALLILFILVIVINRFHFTSILVLSSDRFQTSEQPFFLVTTILYLFVVILLNQ